MKWQDNLLIVVLTIHHTWLFHIADGNNGKRIGEACMLFDDCGESSKSFIACRQNVCQCYDIQYYEQQRSMCVSYVGQKCDQAEPMHGLPELKCGEYAECRPQLREFFGICRCKHGYRENFDRKCVAEDSINSITAAKFNHGKSDANSHTQLSQEAAKSQHQQSKNEFQFSGSNNYRSSKLCLSFITAWISLFFSKLI